MTKSTIKQLYLFGILGLIGATVTVVTDAGSQINFNSIGEGLCSDQSNTLIFGLADAKTVKSITITDTKGNTQIIDNSTINTTVFVGKK